MKKLLTVFFLALLLTLVCSSAMAIGPLYTSKGMNLHNLEVPYADGTKKVYDEMYVTSVEVDGGVTPDCSLDAYALIHLIGRVWDPVGMVYNEDAGITKTVKVPIDKIHLYGLPVVWETTCEKITYKEVCTKCGDIHYYTDINYATNGSHNYVLKTVVEPTCMSQGTQKYICSFCGAEKAGTYKVPALDYHAFSKKVVDKAETCTDIGKYHFQCEWCGKNETDAYGNILYHEIAAHTAPLPYKVVVDKEPTCLEEGEQHYECSLCGENQGAAPNIPALGHNYGAWKKSPSSCKQEERVCSRCGNVDKRDLGAGEWQHSYVIHYQYATSCTKDGQGIALPSQGTMTSICSVCGDSEWGYDMFGQPNTQVIPGDDYSMHKFVHDSSREYANKPAGCVSGPDGKEAVVCTVCGGTYLRTVPHATEHKWGEWEKDGNTWVRHCVNNNCAEIQVSTTKPKDAPTTKPTSTATPTPTPDPTIVPNYRFKTWSFTGTTVSGQIEGTVSYRTPGLHVGVIIYTPTGTFLSTSAAVDENGYFSVSAGGAVYAVSVSLQDNTKTYQNDGKYV